MFTPLLRFYNKYIFFDQTFKYFNYQLHKRAQLVYIIKYNGTYTLSGRTGSALVWHSEVAGSRLTQCSKSCDLQPALQCAIHGAQGVLPKNIYLL